VELESFPLGGHHSNSDKVAGTFFGSGYLFRHRRIKKVKEPRRIDPPGFYLIKRVVYGLNRTENILMSHFKKFFCLFVFCGLVFLLTGCATTKDVMPGENGVNRVSLNSSDGDQGRELAIREAKKYCEDRQKDAVFLDDKTQYKGTMDEQTRKTIKKASNAAILIGGMSQSGSWENGDYHNDTGKVLGGAGTLGHVMTSDKDYQVEVKFKCR
jgi:hypothetical protein